MTARKLFWFSGVDANDRKASILAMTVVLVASGLWVGPALGAPRPPGGTASPGGASVSVKPVTPRVAARGPSDQPAARSAAVVWPVAGTAAVTIAGVGAVSAGVSPGGLPVRFFADPTPDVAARGQRDAVAAVGRPRGARVTVADQSTAARAGVNGVVLSLSRTDGKPAAAPVGLEVGYASFASAFGGGYADRLRLVSLPACALSAPWLLACQTQTSIAGSRNNAATQTVAADAVPVGGDPAARTGAAPTIVAVVSDATSPGNTWAATTLSAAYAWSAGTQGGEFAWSYPLKTPASLGGPLPDLTLRYSSGAVDGQTWASNGQASWVGEGWDLQTGYVERSYRTCSEDGGATGDLCWFSPNNATIVFNGKSMALGACHDFCVSRR